MRKCRLFCAALLIAALGGNTSLVAQSPRELFHRRKNAHTRWASFENTSGEKGQAAKENRGAKGHAFDSLKAGETKVLVNVRGAGSIRRMWLTVNQRDPKMLRALRLEMFWDDAAEPAVSVPFGDFFGAILGRCVAFESEFFSSPEARSFNCFIPMPFRKAARITLSNDSNRDVEKLFYDVDYLLTDKPDAEALYFHATWRRERWTTLGRDFQILPKVRGEGRFLGANIGVIVHPDNTGWWGEGEIKMYLDGDTDYPTLAGTGTEDYIGTGWGQGVFHHRYQGCLVADRENGQFTFYRYHIPDPVYFHRDLRVTMQQIGGTQKSKVIGLIQKGAAVEPVSLDYPGGFVKLLELSPVPDLAKHESPANAWTNMYRRDDWSAVALFYLNSPANGLPKIAGVEKRVEGVLENVPVRK